MAKRLKTLTSEEVIMSEIVKNGVEATNVFDSKKATPKTLILNYRSEVGTLVYDRNSTHKKISRPFTSIFNNLNARVLASHNDIILPNGCIYRATRNDGKEAFLIQEQPGIRSFRLSNRTATISLVAKMYNKFEAQTRVLEKNEVKPEMKEEIKKTIHLRNEYIKQQKLIKADDGKTYKFHFRVYFPYTYLLIVIERTKTNNDKHKLAMGSMCASIALDPINTLNDYVYQFPLSNVSGGGSVCTGKLPLGQFGHINIKTYVEKMTGYFWNNKFNADITFGPETYGDKNFLGNWFEWEYNSYVNPSSILSLKFEDEGIISTRQSVAKYVYTSGNSTSEMKKRVHTINQQSMIEGFEADSPFGDATVDLDNGMAKKSIEGICDTITLEGYEIPLGTLIKDGEKKYKVLSYDGFRTYDIDDSIMYEKDLHVTDFKIINQKKEITMMPFDDDGKTFLADAYRQAKNFVKEAIFENITFKSGELVAFSLDGEFVSEIGTQMDMIKSIRNLENAYIIELFKCGSLVKLNKKSTPTSLRKIDILFSGESTEFGFKSGEEFTYRTRKLLKPANAPIPYTIKDHLSGLITANAVVDKIIYRKTISRGYSYNKTQEREFYIEYTLNKEGFDSDSDHSIRALDCVLDQKDDKCILWLQLPEYVQLASDKYEEIIPEIQGSSTVIIGEQVFQAVTGTHNHPEKVPFKIMRDKNGQSNISTIREDRKFADSMFFLPSIDHLKSCIQIVDRVKTFSVRDLFEVKTEREYITFKVGDEILLSSDWDPLKETSPSIKKIYDFITISDRHSSAKIITNVGIDNDYLTSSMGTSEASIMGAKYKKYAEPIEGISKQAKNRPFNYGITAKVGTLYAVIDDGSEHLILHPMIDSGGQHFLNGISHVKKDVNGIKAGDFVKANVGKIPYFAKKNVDKIVCFIDFNDRQLAVMKSGYTMWADVIEKSFKVFKQDKLTVAKIAFYEDKTREADMRSFMVLYGDQYFSQIGLPILTCEEPDNKDTLHENDYRNKLYKDCYDGELHTLKIQKIELELLKSSNHGSSDFQTFAGFNTITRQHMKLDFARNSFRVMFDGSRCLGSDINSDVHIGKYIESHRFYDICYSLENRSLTNGSAHMEMHDCFRRPLSSYSYYSTPYKVSKDWFSIRHIKVAMSSFPTPRMLKKSTRDLTSFKCYAYKGPQNRFYNYLSDEKIESKHAKHTQKRKNDDKIYNITSDNLFPSEET